MQTIYFGVRDMPSFRLWNAIRKSRAAIRKAGYNPDQPRDNRGRWSGGGSGGGKDLIGPPRYSGYETAGYPEYAAARAAGYPHARAVFEYEQKERVRREKQPPKPDSSGRYTLSVVEGGGGAGTYIAHYDGSGFDDEESPGIDISPAKAEEVLASESHDDKHVQYVLSRGDEEYTWNNKTKSWDR